MTFMIGAMSVSQDYDAIRKQVLLEFGADSEEYFERLHYLKTHPITPKTLAAMLQNRDLDDDSFENEKRFARENGLVIVYGYSDDAIILEGAISDGGDCYGGYPFHLVKDNKKYLLEEEPAEHNTIIAKWHSPDCMTECGEVIPWSFDTDIPHEDFYITFRGDPYCKGFVFSLRDLYDPNQH